MTVPLEVHRLKAILKNTLTWAMDVQLPLLSSYIEKWTEEPQRASGEDSASEQGLATPPPSRGNSRSSASPDSAHGFLASGARPPLSARQGMVSGSDDDENCVQLPEVTQRDGMDQTPSKSMDTSGQKISTVRSRLDGQAGPLNSTSQPAQAMAANVLPPTLGLGSPPPRSPPHQPRGHHRAASTTNVQHEPRGRNMDGGQRQADSTSSQHLQPGGSDASQGASRSRSAQPPLRQPAQGTLAPAPTSSPRPRSSGAGAGGAGFEWAKFRFRDTATSLPPPALSPPKPMIFGAPIETATASGRNSEPTPGSNNSEFTYRASGPAMPPADNFTSSGSIASTPPPDSKRGDAESLGHALGTTPGRPAADSYHTPPRPTPSRPTTPRHPELGSTMGPFNRGTPPPAPTNPMPLGHASGTTPGRPAADSYPSPPRPTTPRHPELGSVMRDINTSTPPSVPTNATPLEHASGTMAGGVTNYIHNTTNHYYYGLPSPAAMPQAPPPASTDSTPGRHPSQARGGY